MMKKFLLLGLILILVLASCDNGGRGNTTDTKGTVVLTLENDLVELGFDAGAIKANSYTVEIYSNGKVVDSFNIDNIDRTSKYVFDEGSAKVSKIYEAGSYTAVVYAKREDGSAFGKGRCEFTVIGGTSVDKTAIVDCSINTINSFLSTEDPTKFNGKEYAINGHENSTLFLFHTNVQPEIKYVNLKSFLDYFVSTIDDASIYKEELDDKGTLYRITNGKTGAYLEIDTEKETLHFSNYERFFKTDAAAPLVTAVVDKDCIIVGQNDIPGKPMTISYGYYITDNEREGHYALDITPCREGEDILCLIPFNIATDLQYEFQTYNFNGEGIYYYYDTNYYDKANLGEFRSQAIAEFNILDFCFNMDLNYGLASQHNIDDGFLNWLYDLDEGHVVEKLLKTDDISYAKRAYEEIVYKYFGDLHSSYPRGSHSFYTGTSATTATDFDRSTESSTSERHYMTTYNKILQARKSWDIIETKTIGEEQRSSYEGLSLWGYNLTNNTYEKIGFEYNGNSELVVTDIANYSDVTLYITFDSFTYYYSKKSLKEMNHEDFNNIIKNFGFYEEISSAGYDTRALAEVANKVVKDFDALPGSPEIKNVAVDLSCNGGGAVDAEIYMGSLLMGQVDHSVVNPITNAKSLTTYMVDLNGDGYVGTFDKPNAEDTISDKQVFVITSRCSFSCGNMLPYQLKVAGDVGILGSTTGGGSCAVLPFTTVDGTLLKVSSNLRFSYEKNGSFYDTDTGVEPDYKFTDWDMYGDRARITSIINNSF